VRVRELVSIFTQRAYSGQEQPDVSGRDINTAEGPLISPIRGCYGLKLKKSRKLELTRDRAAPIMTHILGG
jgi:hypothetical protein